MPCRTSTKRGSPEIWPSPDDPYYTMNTGAVWWDVLPQLPLTGAVVDISSVGDGSGDPVNNVCQASDSSVNYTSQPSAIQSWSATRWLSLSRRSKPSAGDGREPRQHGSG